MNRLHPYRLVKLFGDTTFVMGDGPPSTPPMVPRCIPIAAMRSDRTSVLSDIGRLALCSSRTSSARAPRLPRQCHPPPALRISPPRAPNRAKRRDSPVRYRFAIASPSRGRGIGVGLLDGGAEAQTVRESSPCRSTAGHASVFASPSSREPPCDAQFFGPSVDVFPMTKSKSGLQRRLVTVAPRTSSEWRTTKRPASKSLSIRLRSATESTPSCMASRSAQPPPS